MMNTLPKTPKPRLFMFPNWAMWKAHLGQSAISFASVLLAFFLIAIGMLFVSEHLSPQSAALTRFMAKNQAPLIGKNYPSEAQKEITVLMYDQDFLVNTNSGWPIKYSDHADWLLRIAEQKPKAIFVDITFDQKRDDSTVGQLRETLCLIKKKYGVPIFLAGLSKSEVGGRSGLRVRDELMPASDNAEDDCYKLVSVNFETDKVDHISWNYPLFSYRDTTGWQQLHASHFDGELMRSPALAMANDVAEMKLNSDSDPVALVWGLKGSSDQLVARNLNNCKPGEFSTWMMIPAFISYFFYDNETRVCPYNRSLSMSQVGELDDEENVQYIKDKYVLVGASIPGSNDFVESPIHGLLPGVFLHAMALDNLLTFGTAYKRDVEWAHPTRELFKAAISAVLLVFSLKFLLFLFPIGWKSFTRFLERKIPFIKSFFETIGKEIEKLFGPCLRRLGAEVGRVTLWTTGLVLKTIVAMIAISWFQEKFNIGMLPVADLISVVIFAEALEWLKHLQYIANGKSQD